MIQMWDKKRYSQGYSAVSFFVVTIRNYTTLKHDARDGTPLLCFATIKNYAALKHNRKFVCITSGFATIKNYTTLKL